MVFLSVLCPLCGAVWRWSGGEVGRGGLLHLLSSQLNAGRHWRGTLACLLSNNYSLSIIEPLQFADLILTPKLAKYTNKTFGLGSSAVHRQRQANYHLLITDVARGPDNFFVSRCLASFSASILALKCLILTSCLF